MLVDELIRDGVCDDLEEALSMFPIELIDDFRPTRRTRCPGEPTLGNGPGQDLWQADNGGPRSEPERGPQ